LPGGCKNDRGKLPHGLSFVNRLLWDEAEKQGIENIRRLD